MKLVLILFLWLAWGCAKKQDQNPKTPNQSAWTLNEPQIANKRGKIFLTNVQHQGKQPLELTDSLIFDLNDKDLNLTFTTLTRCYDLDQKELIETKSFPFQQKITIQKLLPKESFHPKYIVKKQTLNCTFKFKVEKQDGSSHNFRLYSQSVNLSEQVDSPLITIAGKQSEDIQVLDKDKIHEEHFIIPDIEVDKLELICQNFKSKFLAQKNLLNPFYGFNIKSVDESTYPRELCRIIGEKNGDYIISKPFQIAFKNLEFPLSINVFSHKYNYSSNNIRVAKIIVENPYNFIINLRLTFPKEIMINKMGKNYPSPFQIEYKNTNMIKKFNEKVFDIKLESNERAEFTISTNLTRACYNKEPLAIGSTLVNDMFSDIYFSPKSLKINTDWHPEFYYKTKIFNKNYLSVKIHNSVIKHRLLKKRTYTNVVNKNYNPPKNNKCLSSPPKIESINGNFSPF